MRWMWIDRIVEHEPGRRLVAVKNVSLAEEHLHDHFAAADGTGHGARGGAACPVMPATLMIEGMAQTAGILVGSVHRFREKVILAKIVTARFEAEVVPGDCVRYEADLEQMHSGGAATRGVVKRRGPQEGAAWEVIGDVDLMFSHIDQNVSGLAFPKENFVFSENFKLILAWAGLGGLAE